MLEEAFRPPVRAFPRPRYPCRMRMPDHWLRAVAGLADGDLQPGTDRVAAVSKAFLTVIIAFVVLHVSLIAIVGFNRSTRLFAASVAGCGVLLIARWLIGRGFVRSGTWLGVATALAVGLFAGWLSAYIGVAQAAWVFVGVSYCTLILGFRAGATATFVSLAAYAMLALAIERHQVRSQIVPYPFNQWLNLFTPSMVLLVSMGVIREAFLESVRRQFASVDAAASVLEATVEDRTAALEIAVKDLQTLTYLLSHDLMGKVSVIQSFTSVTLEREGGQLSDEGRRRLGRVEDNARQMQHMIQGLMVYARASTLQPSLQPVAVGRVLASITADLQHEYPHATIGWSVPEVRTDPVMLRHILQNLVGNACKFGAPGGPKVDVSGRHAEEETVFCVTDNGPGFDPAEQDRLFDLFHRGSHTASHGHGVGLAVVKHLVERLGGRVWAENAHPGAKFCFTVPFSFGSSPPAHHAGIPTEEPP